MRCKPGIALEKGLSSDHKSHLLLSQTRLEHGHLPKTGRCMQEGVIRGMESGRSRALSVFALKCMRMTHEP